MACSRVTFTFTEDRSTGEIILLNTLFYDDRSVVFSSIITLFDQEIIICTLAFPVTEFSKIFCGSQPLQNLNAPTRLSAQEDFVKGMITCLYLSVASIFYFLL